MGKIFKKWNKFKYHGKIDKLILNATKEKVSLEFIDEQDNTKNFKFLSNNDSFYFCHDIMKENENIYIPVNFKDKKGASEFPRIIMVSEKNFMMNDLRKKIYLNFRKLILSPFKQIMKIQMSLIIKYLIIQNMLISKMDLFFIFIQDINK